jgi:multiple sugar transport system substrate-binding protein
LCCLSDETENKSETESKSESWLPIFNEKMSRRKAISTLGKAAIGIIGVVLIGGVAYGVLSSGQKVPLSSTTTSSNAAASNSTSQFAFPVSTSSTSTGTSIPGTGPEMDFVTWIPVWYPKILGQFNTDWNDNAQLVALPGDWDLVMEARFQSGAPVDALNSQGGQGARWYAAGWIADLNQFPGTDDYKKLLFPKVVEGSTMMDGAFIGYNLYIQTYGLYRNEKMLAQIGYEGTSSQNDYQNNWDDIFNICMELKQKGISDQPFLPTFQQAVYGLPWDFIQNCAGEGEELVDSTTYDAVFDTNTPIVDVFTNYKRFWDADLIPQSSLTVSQTDASTQWESGNYAFKTWITNDITTYNDPTLSTIGGSVNIAPIWPGKTGEFKLTSISLANAAGRGSGQPGYRSTPYTPALMQRVAHLLQSVGGQYPVQSGETLGPVEGTNFNVINNYWWASTLFYLNLTMNPYPDFYNDPSVQPRVAQSMYPPIADAAATWWLNLISVATPFAGFRVPWWAQWEVQLQDGFADMLNGNTSITDFVTTLRTSYDNLQKQFAV